MDPTTLYELLERGGPLALAAVALTQWYLERKERRAAQEELLKLSTAVVSAVSKNESTIAGFTKLLEKFLER